MDNDLFPPDSVLRQVSGELTLLLGGGRALLLELAHPLIAAGVAEHSSFQYAPVARLERTLDLMLTLSLGTEREGQALLKHFQAAHVPVRGTLEQAVGPFPAGTAYTAQDPALKVWVAATLLDTTLLTHELFIGPLSPAQRRAFYADTQIFARRLGIPAGMWPPTLAAFAAYMAEMLDSPVLTVTDTARSLAQAVLHPPVGFLPRQGAHLLGFVAAGLLPPRLRRAYGLPWSKRQQCLFRLWTAGSRQLTPALPRALRYHPQAGGSELVRWVLAHSRTAPPA